MTNLDKSDVLDGLFAVWDEIDTVLAGLADEQWQAQTPLPGWTVHDVTAHLIGTESMLQGAATPDADIDVSTLKHVRNDVGVMNERWVRKLRGVSPADLLDKFRATTAQRREALSGIGDADWNQITATPAGPDTYGRFMRVRDFDCWMHQHDIRDALGSAARRRPRRPGVAAGAGRDGGQHGLRRRQARRRAGRIAGGDRADRAAGAHDQRRGRGPGRRWSTTSAAGSRRRRSRWTVCCSPGWPAAARRQRGIPTPIDYGGDEAVGRRVVEHLNYVI